MMDDEASITEMLFFNGQVKKKIINGQEIFVPHGQCTIIFPNGDKFTGHWDNGKNPNAVK